MKSLLLAVVKIPVMKGKTGTRKGYATITKHLARTVQQSLIGEKLEDKAVIDQWLEYKTCIMDRCSTDKDAQTTLNDCNRYLADKVYFYNHQLSLIDLVFYYTLHSTMKDMTYYQKQKYVHLSRWFDNLQQSKAVRQTYSPVILSRTKLYS